MKYFLFALLLPTIAFAEIVDLKEYQSSVKNQLDRNTCAYFATTAALESAVKVKFGKEYDISEEYQTFIAKTKFGDHPDSEHGATYEILLSFKNQFYFYLEEDIPYQTSYFENDGPCAEYDYWDSSAPAFCFSHAPIETPENMRKVRIDGIELNWLTGMWSPGSTRSDLMMREIKLKRSPVITLKVYPPLWGDDGVVKHGDETEAKCQSGEIDCYGHAIILTGFDTERHVFFFKNSWGENWGKDGYGEVSFEYVNKWSDSPYSISFTRWGTLLKEVNF